MEKHYYMNVTNMLNIFKSSCNFYYVIIFIDKRKRIGLLMAYGCINHNLLYVFILCRLVMTRNLTT